MNTSVGALADFSVLLMAAERSPEIPESADLYGWLCGSWDLDVIHYRGLGVADRGLTGEVHAARVLEGRAVQDLWIMPRREDRQKDFDRTMNMYGTTLAIVGRLDSGVARRLDEPGIRPSRGVGGPVER